MADEEENFDEELNALDAPEDGAVEEGADAPEHTGEPAEGDDEPGAGGQAGAKADQSEGAQDHRLSRGEGRIARLARELKETKERDLARERELGELKARLHQVTQPQGETAEQRQQRLDGMTTEERLTYLWQESEHRNEQRRQYDQFQMNDRNDQQLYQARMAADKRAAKYKDEVETTLREFRQAGYNPKREAVYFYLLGMKVANAGGKPSQGQAAGVARRQAANRTSPANSGGDVGRSQRAKSLEQKLDGVPL